MSDSDSLGPESSFDLDPAISTSVRPGPVVHGPGLVWAFA
jgi:hypothetical protein